MKDIGRLWAPWRAAFVRGDYPAPEGCIFCLFPAETDDHRNFIVHRAPEAFVILNRYPYNNGHLMVVPRAHVPSLEDLAAPALHGLHELLQRSVAAVRKVYAPEGMNIGMNLGKVAGAGIADHLHYHVVPRWNGDTNFMPVLAETRVLIESLEASWERLKSAF